MVLGLVVLRPAEPHWGRLNMKLATVRGRIARNQSSENGGRRKLEAWRDSANMKAVQTKKYIAKLVTFLLNQFQVKLGEASRQSEHFGASAGVSGALLMCNGENGCNKAWLLHLNSRATGTRSFHLDASLTRQMLDWQLRNKQECLPPLLPS